ncbi:MAG: hypothetical protein ACI9MJ_000194 [Alphaproteobacteria bacterium]|jgi:hypothetical protein
MSPRSSLTSFALVLLNLALGWQINEEMNRPPAGVASTGSTVSMSAIEKPKEIGPKKLAITLPPIDSFKEITSRPLFNVSRRPIAIDSSAPVEETTELNVMLSGIVIGEVEQIAHLRSVDDNQVQALRVGDRIGSWQVEVIKPDQVVLRSGNQVKNLFMQKPGADGTAMNRSTRGAKTTAASKARRTLNRAKLRARKRSGRSRPVPGK